MPNNTTTLEKKLSIEFKNPQLLKEALTHRSFLNETKGPVSSNERLEFLGDAVLELLVSDYLFKKYPQYTEGKLTNLRSAVVNTKTLATVAKKLQLGEYLYLSRGEEAGGGRNNASLLADVFESVLGAVYIDRDLIGVEKLLRTNLFPLIDEVLQNGSYFDYKSLLQEKVQEKYRVTPVYTVVKEEGPDHAKIFYSAAFIDKRKLGEGKGKSKQEAEQDAARTALEAWNAS